MTDPKESPTSRNKSLTLIKYHKGDLESLISGNHHALVLGKYSNLKIICGAGVYEAHRVIVCMRSSFFAAACDGNFLEAHTNRIVLEGDDLMGVKRMISYFYGLSYSDHEIDTVSFSLDRRPSPQEKEIIQAKLAKNIAVYSIADKYGIKGPKSLARYKFNDLINCPGVWPFRDFAAILQQLFDTTPPDSPNDSSEKGIWAIVAGVCVVHAEDVLKDKNCCSILHQADGFGFELLVKSKGLIDYNDWQDRFFGRKINLLEAENKKLEDTNKKLEDKYARVKKELKDLRKSLKVPTNFRRRS